MMDDGFGELIKGRTQEATNNQCSVVSVATTRPRGDRPGTGSNVSREPVKNLILAGTIVIVWGTLVATVSAVVGFTWWVSANDRPLAGLLGNV